MNPLVSVIIPTYKRPTNLKRAIESVLNQNYDNIEIKVVDDNSPNTPERLETEELMRQYEQNEKVTYLRHEFNKGGAAARNTGWRESKGVYITFLDDDDEMLPNRISNQVSCLEALDNSWGACYTAYFVERANGKLQKSAEKRSGMLYVDALMKTLYIMAGSNLLIRKSVVGELKGFDESFIRNQDIEFLVRILEKYKLAYIDKYLLIVHWNRNNTTKDFNKIDGYATYYLSIFSDRIRKLSQKDQRRVIAVISLERFRAAIRYHKYKRAVQILRENKVGFWYIVRYIFYIVHRLLTKRSYGFKA